MKKKLSEREINDFAQEIYEILRDIPLFYLHEILELADDVRQRDGELQDLDITSDSDNEDD